MSRADRVAGLARSLAIYHLIPLRQRRMRALYRSFVRPGDLVFDVGAHVGNRTRAFDALGCRVVAVEPQPHVAALLRRLVGRSTSVTVVEAAVAEAAGRAPLSVSERTPTVSTLTTAWRDARAVEEGFRGVEWNRSVDVETTTLDLLIARFGMPAFVKMDIEGGELGALRGLTRPVHALSFEFLPRALPAADACAARLESLGPYRFNWSPGESNRLASPSWLDRKALLSSVSAAAPGNGDIYARLEDA
jgi:FkbM family methyltransferase